MENRERDKMRKDMGSDSGNINRDTSSRMEKDKSDSPAGFNKNRGQADNLNEPNSRGSSGLDSGDRSSSGGGRH